jgi:hypothetical protein
MGLGILVGPFIQTKKAAKKVAASLSLEVDLKDFFPNRSGDPMPLQSREKPLLAA